MDFYKILDLPEIIMKDKNNYINKNINTNAWEIDNWSQRLRLDSSFYDPHAKTTVNILAKKFKLVQTEPVLYERRRVSQGKKIKFSDGIVILRRILYYYTITK